MRPTQNARVALCINLSTPSTLWPVPVSGCACPVVVRSCGECGTQFMHNAHPELNCDITYNLSARAFKQYCKIQNLPYRRKSCIASVLFAGHSCRKTKDFSSSVCAAQ